MMNRIVYICDKKACDSTQWASCRFIKIGNNRCSHTTDPKHAKYGICKDPEKHPERFEQLEDGDFWEVENEIL